MLEIKQQRDKAIELYIYDDVDSDSASEASAKHLRDALAKYPQAQEIKIYINSYGGSVFEGMAIYNQLKRHPAQKTVYIDGFACSIASVIAMAGDVVIMPRNAMMMIHNMWMVACGNASELRKIADDLEKINIAGRQAYLTRCKGKLEEAKLAQMMDEETWLTAEQCIEYGLADQLAEEEADLTRGEEILQKIDEIIARRISDQKAMIDQLKQLTQPAPEEKPKNNLLNTLAGKMKGV